MKYRFVDRIVSLEPGQTIHCQYSWPDDLEIFEDHFPGFAVVPGVLLTEMMGQSAALCVESARADGTACMLLQIRNAQFRQWVKPGETLDTHAEILSLQDKIVRISVKTGIGDQIRANAELLMTFDQRQNLGLPAVDPLLESFYRDSNSD